MKLLIVTQVVDSEDLYLGFFHRWIEELAPRFEKVEVICLKEGRHALPDNVRVHSLGKEKGAQPSYVYAIRFLKHIWKLRHHYDAVFVHMNQEYVLIGGVLFEILGKRIFLWRNHYAGSWLTDIAASFCRKVFYTSKHSYTAKFKRSVQMPVGVDTERFHPDATVSRVPHSILFFGRMSHSKRPGLVVDALIELHKRGELFTARFVGSPLPSEELFLTALKQRVSDAGLNDQIKFEPGIDNMRAANLYRSHQIYVNAGRSGMLDKTIFEAAASGCVVLAASDDYRLMAGDAYFFSNATELADRLAGILPGLSQADIPALVQNHSLKHLVERLQEEVVG